MNERQWEEVKIEDVKPGDVARCNGREFPVERDDAPSIRSWRIVFGHLQLDDACKVILEALGFTFWRKVKREPRAFTGTLTGCLPFSHSIEVTLDMPPSREWPIEQGARLRVEILDGEDGA